MVRMSNSEIKKRETYTRSIEDGSMLRKLERFIDIHGITTNSQYNKVRRSLDSYCIEYPSLYTLKDVTGGIPEFIKVLKFANEDRKVILNLLATTLLTYRYEHELDEEKFDRLFCTRLHYYQRLGYSYRALKDRVGDWENFMFNINNLITDDRYSTNYHFTSYFEDVTKWLYRYVAENFTEFAVPEWNREMIFIERLVSHSTNGEEFDIKINHLTVVKIIKDGEFMVKVHVLDLQYDKYVQNVIFDQWWEEIYEPLRTINNEIVRYLKN